MYSYFGRNPKLRVLFIFDNFDMIGSELHNVDWL